MQLHKCNCAFVQLLLVITGIAYNIIITQVVNTTNP